jgi:hypothetical protein
MTSSSLMSSWAVCGIAAAAARFVPVPLLDDVVRSRAAQVAVVRTVRAHGLDHPTELLEPLWGDPGGRRAGLRRRLRAVPGRLLLFPLRKYRAVFGAVRGVPTDVMRVVLLARTVDRRLDRGDLRDPDRVTEQARALRRAVDETIDEMDLRLLLGALGSVLSQTRGLTTAAVAFARRRFARSGVDDDGALDPDAPLAEGAERVTEVLRRPEVASLLDRFDSGVDARLTGSR